MTLGFVSFLVGIGLVGVGAHLYGLLWPLLAIGLLILCRKRMMLVAVPAVIASGLLVGNWRGSDSRQQIDAYTPLFGQKVSLQGNVVEDPTYDDDSQQVMLLEHIVVNNRALPGTVRVKTLAPVEPRRGDRVQVGGKLYDGFGNYQASLYYADMQVTEVAKSPIDTLRREFAARIYGLLPDTQAGLGLGFLLGIKSSLPDSLNDELKLLGLTHIVVASGYNLTVLVRLARRFLAKSSHYQMTIASFAMIAGFVAVTGFSPSMSRAALVAGLSVLAAYYGRRIHPALLISLAAAITAAVNPLYVWVDIGWWLSFLAFAGVMMLSPLLQRRIFGEREPKLLGQVVLETVSAEILTLPLVVLIFGNLSVLSLLSNVLVVPLIPLAMLLTFVAGAIGTFIPFVAWPAIWLLGYVCQLVHVLSQVSWASVPLAISPLIFIICNAAVFIVGLLLWRKTKHDYLSQSVIE
jgi:competence protein ComEC